ncbi:MAG: TonB-dependent receptor [Saprospiraceae bacterium]
MKSLITLLSLAFCVAGFSQNASIKGQLQDADGQAIAFANVVLYNTVDSNLVKVETTDESGIFKMVGLPAGKFYIEATYVGLNPFTQADINLTENQDLDLGVLKFKPASIELAEATVTASRAMVEIKPDRTVFNVEGTINSVGSDGLSLLRKAPGVTVDNNDNVNVLGRSGVLVYVDGKRLPLTGTDLSNYLQNLTAEQIDRIDIITNPGAKYEAEGNAGIIDIRLKRDKRFGANGSLSSTYSQGRYHRANINGTGNYRNKLVNVFGNLGYADGAGFNRMVFDSYQNGLRLDEINNHNNDWDNLYYQLGTDFFIGKQHTIGFLVGGNRNTRHNTSLNRIAISPQSDINNIDSILVATNTADNSNMQGTYNLNYRYDNAKGRVLNVDLDYGSFNNDSERYQPNLYYDPTETTVLTEIINSFETPSDISISTFKLDYEDKLWGGTLGAGTKLSQVISDNTFLFYDVMNGGETRNDRKSNIFKYDERVYAGYINYAGSISKTLQYSAGIRAEKTDATGDLQAFLPELQEPPVILDYLSWFPSAGLTWQAKPMHTLSLNYGRRINRPDYNVLNPFNFQISQLSFEKGNPFLRPEIVNNIELGYTLKYRYNFKLSFSKTEDQITRLIAPDSEDSRAGFITWENLAEQNLVSLNISAPTQITEWWSLYVNAGASYIDNQADYGNGAVVDVQAFTYSFYQQSSFTLPWKLKGEISGYYSGPGIWGGVFRYESNWSLDLGLQRKFLNDKLNVRIGVSDLFYETGWDGESEFNGLKSFGSGRWDSRRGSISLSYNFGNENVKSRKRKTGLEDEKNRVGGE